MPNIFGDQFTSTPENPEFFRTDIYQSYIKKNENVILLPYGINGDSLVWQAEDDFYYRMAGGYFYLGGPWTNAIVDDLYSGYAARGFFAQFKIFAKSRDIGAIIVDDAYIDQCRTLLHRLHTRPVKVAGVEIFNIKHRRRKVSSSKKII